MTEEPLHREVLEAADRLSAERLLWRIRPAAAQDPPDWEQAVTMALHDTIGAPIVEHLAREAEDIVILADDLTRPTPQKKILPPLLNYLNAAGAADDSIAIIIALGTHRAMRDEEIEERFGREVCSRVAIVNHRWEDDEIFVDLGVTESGTPILVNRRAYEADLLIGTGSIVPHIYAGWGGGAKIVQPGVCSDRTTARTHCMAAESDDLLGIPGREDNPVRREMERVAARVGLDFVLNVVVDPDGTPIWIGAGEPVQTHRRGVEAAREEFVRPVPARAEVVLADARPAVKDYWQGIKGVAHATRGLKRGGTAILVGEFPERVAPTHPDFARHALKSYDEIAEAVESGRLDDRIASASLRLHALVREHCRVICVSPGLSAIEKEELGFQGAGSVQEALGAALDSAGPNARVGVMEFAGDVLPRPPV